jgi:hypothetical protein
MRLHVIVTRRELVHPVFTAGRVYAWEVVAAETTGPLAQAPDGNG